MGADSTAPASYDTSAPCNGADQQIQAGFYPELEALLPSSVTLASPSPGATPEPVGTLAPVQSGRYCSAATLGALADSGLKELHFAAAPWPTGPQEGLSLVVYRAPGLTADQLADAFTAAAAKATAIAQISTQAVTIAGRHGVRIQVNNNDQLQTVVFWAAGAADTVNAVISADPFEAHLQAAISAFGTR
ncbi:MAG: hypothetical protein ACXVAE_02455 [Candidatus Limnocylindrales bacterium]